MQFLEGARGSKHYLLYRLLLETGLRLGEALALTWADIGFTNGVLIVREGKTQNARRALRLSDEVVRELRAVRGVGLVFHTKMGRPLDHSTIRNDYFYPMLNRLKLPRIRLHDLRHLNASLMLQQGVDLATVKREAGSFQQSIHTSSVHAYAFSGAGEGRRGCQSTVSQKRDFSGSCSRAGTLTRPA